MSDYLVRRIIRMTDADIEKLEFAPLSDTAKKVFQQSILPYAHTLLSGTETEKRDLVVRLTKQYFGANSSVVPRNPESVQKTHETPSIY